MVISSLGLPQAEEGSLKSGLLELRGGSPGFRSRSWRLVTNFPLFIFYLLLLTVVTLYMWLGVHLSHWEGLLKIDCCSSSP